MSIIATPEPGEATGEVAEIYAEDTASLGYVPSHTRVMATHPEACRLAHGKKSLKYITEVELGRIARDFYDADLSAAKVAMMEFFEKLSTDSASMTDADSTTMRKHGFTDREIVDITLAAAARPTDDSE